MYNAAASTVNLLAKVHNNYVDFCNDQGTAPLAFDPAILLTLLQTFVPLIMNCKKKPPAPAPVPAPVVAAGVSEAQWTDASNLHWVANDAWNDKRKKFNAGDVRDYAKAYKAKNGGSLSEAKAQTLTAFKTARESTPDDLAVAIANTSAIQSA